MIESTAVKNLTAALGVLLPESYDVVFFYAKWLTGFHSQQAMSGSIRGNSQAADANYLECLNHFRDIKIFQLDS